MLFPLLLLLLLSLSLSLSLSFLLLLSRSLSLFFFPSLTLSSFLLFLLFLTQILSRFRYASCRVQFMWSSRAATKTSLKSKTAMSIQVLSHQFIETSSINNHTTVHNVFLEVHPVDEAEMEISQRKYPETNLASYFPRLFLFYFYFFITWLAYAIHARRL